MSILESIFNGDISFFEKINFKDNKESYDLNRKITELEDELFKNLSLDKISTYEKLMDLYATIHYARKETVFKASFALGIQLMNEIYKSDLFDI